MLFLKIIFLRNVSVRCFRIGGVVDCAVGKPTFTQGNFAESFLLENCVARHRPDTLYICAVWENHFKKYCSAVIFWFKKFRLEMLAILKKVEAIYSSIFDLRGRL